MPCPEEARLASEMRSLARANPSWGSPTVTARLRLDGWSVNHKRIERLWRQEGLQVPRKRIKRRRLGSSAQGILRHRSLHVNHVWSYDFVFDRTEDGRRLKILGVVDEYSRECLALVAARHLRGGDLCCELDRLVDLHGRPEHLRSDNGPEFAADCVRSWLDRRGVDSLFIAPGSPWENAYIESFFGGLRRDLLDREAFSSLLEAQVLLEQHRIKYNEYRPHRSLGNVPPAAFRRTLLGNPTPATNKQLS
jgi:putative transposase